MVASVAVLSDVHGMLSPLHRARRSSSRERGSTGRPESTRGVRAAAPETAAPENVVVPGAELLTDSSGRCIPADDAHQLIAAAAAAVTEADR